MKKIFSFFKQLWKLPSEADLKLIQAVERITGKKPKNLQLYRLAMIHSSKAVEIRQGFKESNERLEYLGDAVLSLIVAEYLFKQYPFHNEGFLTEIRSRIVNRETLNHVAIKIGLRDLVDFDGKRNHSHPAHKSIYGDAFEALIGAIYLDRGFHFTQRFIIEKLLHIHYNLEEIIENSYNYKSKIIEWAQKNGCQLQFLIDEYLPDANSKNKQFKAQLILDGTAISEGFGYSKKKASQDAARRACYILMN
ncbi:MAG: ribonuclease III [Cytophagales bacterium]|nr:ribonuclease III [Cytophagales bacterium]MDW8383768.1 ribonuclease III [Flammeovirgaceae bacterium]